MLYIVGGCDKRTHLDRGDDSSSAGSFGYDAINSICFNSRDDVLADSRKIVDALLIKVRHVCEVGDAFVSKTKNRSI